MKQVSLAVLLYVDRNGDCIPPVHRRPDLPAGFKLPAGSPPVSRFSWRATVLPFLERQPLHDAIDFRLSSVAPANLPVARTQVAEYQCPSTPGYLRVIKDMGTDWSDVEVAHKDINVAGSDYQGVWQIITESVEYWAPAGAWAGRNGGGFDDDMRLPGLMKEVTDGHSNTILLHEIAGLPTFYFRKPSYSVEEHIHDGAWLRQNVSTVNVDLGINNLNFTNLFSFHPGGVYASMCDGSVHFVADRATVRVVWSLLSRDGGEPVNPKDWQ